MGKMNLRIERGILLKPWTAPYSRKNGGEHRIPSGWTPERTPAMQARFDEMRAEAEDAPDFLLWKQVELEEGQRLAKMRRPYPGWFPVRPRSDRPIVKAYRALFLRMNPEAEKRVKLAGKWSGPQAEYPPDGDYVLEGGVMTLVAMPVSLANRSVLALLTDDFSIRAEDVKARIEALRGVTSED